MALLITKNETILGNIDVTELYVRFSINFNIQGNKIEVVSQTYPSRESYDADVQTNTVLVDGIPYNAAFDYDRAVDGSDLLTATHNKFKTVLTTDTMRDDPVLDPSTGQPTYDPSTGEPITTPVVDVPRFTMDSSVALIDID